MSPTLADALAALPVLARAHLLLSGSAVLIGVALGLPLAILSARHPRLRTPVLGLAGLVQTVPALALLALFYPALLILGQATGLAIPALGFLPALIALSLYALLPIVRNGVAALQGIDPAVLEAADGLGMTARQRLTLIELPLGAPVILAGIRTASVWTIGAATLATTVGQPSLGDLIFSGLQTENWVRVLTGCAAAAALALAVDGLLALVETGLRRRSRWRVRTGLMALATALGLAMLPAGPSGGETIVVGAKNFSEQYILASAIERRLQAAGFRTERRDNLGSTVAYQALAAGDIDVYVDYSGTLWANILGRTDTPPANRMRQVLTEELRRRDGVTLLGPLGFENAYALAMRRSRAAALGVRSLGDLTLVAPQLRLGADLEFLTRPEWRAVQGAYRLRFAAQTSYSPTFMYRAVANGSADVITAFSSDGRIAALDLVTLGDPRRALPSYDAVLLLAPRHDADSRLAEALRPLIGAIPVGRMRQANLLVDRDTDKRTPAEAARWLDP
ncbi:ABC transporter permease/substrate-binding protein [Sphingosinicella sp. LHD-64]|uniref:ABC transporter permease/substrate-binding protein n=1 Tax=Sphingosinicella sp. LHD-64 TaxID=3072139 RepID=UPI00280DC997|nr:ABC transporter permease/substrate-binding protein [Sphingosinicella sp. LHD-64]MDQ8754642.1 ABC transporter permease/substrate-binding protein [Sphingosinicella sp. LHD-64]